MRPTVAALRAAGHRASLLAPMASGRALVGPGLSEVDLLLPWDGVDAIGLSVAGAALAPGLADRLATFQAAIAYTRSEATIAQLASVVRRVVARDPQPGEDGLHASAWLARAVRDLDVDEAKGLPAPPLGPTEGERAEARLRLSGLPRGFVAVHPGSGSPRKNWLRHRFAEAARRLAEGSRWLLVQGPAETDDRDGAFRDMDVLVAREWPPRVLAAALAEAGVFLGNDSGVTHLAAAAGAPTVALFGPTDPVVWSPIGRNVIVVASPDRTMEGIEVDAVVAAGASARAT